jgi:hypothetical protein
LIIIQKKRNKLIAVINISTSTRKFLRFFLAAFLIIGLCLTFAQATPVMAATNYEGYITEGSDGYSLVEFGPTGNPYIKNINLAETFTAISDHTVNVVRLLLSRDSLFTPGDLPFIF